ncbi:MAG TPA: N utilization substance protein B, partial [Sulfurimonas autotrophica]|nr:N utilization substance protein B [Sulfurimonas autotrophica]
MATRHHARMAVVSLLYAFDLGNGNTSEHTTEILEEKKIRNKQRDFALDLYEGVMAHLEEIDKAIIEHLKDWDFERLGAI